jgi:Flp pilus assembly protein TadD
MPMLLLSLKKVYGVMIALGILIAFYVAFYVTWPFIIIFHELGHAFAYLILTKQSKIDIFIGSYGDKKTRLNFKIGKLHFYVKQSFLLYISGGMCQASSAEPNYIKDIIILLAGPFFSLFIACVLGFIVFNTEIHGAIKLYVCSLIIFSVISLISSLVPRTIESVNIDNDGKQLFFVIRIRKVYADYISAYKEVATGMYTSAADKLHHAVNICPKEEKLLRLLINALFGMKNYKEGEIYLNQLKEISTLTATEHLHLGYTQSISGKSELAERNYEKALELDPNNLIALNNLGYEYIVSGRYTEAEHVLNEAIKLDPEFNYSYSNMGYVKLLTNKLDEGKELIEKSLAAEPEDAYAYKHLGVYYLKILDKDQALLNFNKALALDPNIVLEGYLKESEEL